MTAILALDQGTTSSRALVFDESGAQLAMAQRELRQIFPRLGWVEHDPLEIWESQLAVAREALAAAGVGAAGIAALGITNQRETVVVWERATGRPIAHAIVLQEPRRRADRHRHRLAGPAHRAGLRAAAARGPADAGRRAHRVDPRPLLLGHQARLAARSPARRPGRGGGGAARLRHHRLLADLEPDRRRAS